MKKALITGVTGQDGAYLADLLLKKGYEVHGMKRPTSTFSTGRLEQLGIFDRIRLHYGDLIDTASIQRVLRDVQPDEVYNLGAQSHVKISFDLPEYTGNVDALGTLRLLESIRTVGLADKVRFYQASSSEMFGDVRETPQIETTPFYPRSPYGVAKTYAHWITVNYRESYGMHASSGILFNHESPLRGENFVTRKITRGLAMIKAERQSSIALGNLDARRDWGHSRDFVEAMWMMLQQDKPDDYVIATGVTRSVREFAETAVRLSGMGQLEWRGTGLDEVGYSGGRAIIVVDPSYYRPAEVDYLRGFPLKAEIILGWKPRTSFEDMVDEMLYYDKETVQ